MVGGGLQLQEDLEFTIVLLSVHLEAIILKRSIAVGHIVAVVDLVVEEVVLTAQVHVLDMFLVECTAVLQIIIVVELGRLVKDILLQTAIV